MDSQTAILALKALDGLSARVTVTAENIANAGTPGYRPLRVSFEDQLKMAAGKDAASIETVRPFISRAAFPIDQSDMRLDLELATAAGTAGRYAALIEVLNRQMQLSSLALTGEH